MNHGQQPGVGVGGMPMVGISPSSMMASSPQQIPGMMSQQQNPGQPHPMGMPGQPQPTDNISKVKSLMVPLRDSLSVIMSMSFNLFMIYLILETKIVSQTTLKQAAQLVQHNNMTDNGNLLVFNGLFTELTIVTIAFSFLFQKGSR